MADNSELLAQVEDYSKEQASIGDQISELRRKSRALEDKKNAIHRSIRLAKLRESNPDLVIEEA